MARARAKTAPEGLRKAVFSSEIFGPAIDSPADEIVNDAWDAETPAQRIKLARQALDVDLDAIDAYNILGIHAATHAERIALFREAVIVGQRLFAPMLNDPTGDGDEDVSWWGFLGTRPWMRAQHNLGLALIAAGDRNEAVGVLRRLLALNPNDNQGIRSLLLQLFAEAGDYDNCRILAADYAEDGSLDFTATRLLIDIATRRKMSFPEQIARVEASNAHALPLLLTAARTGKWPKRPTNQMIAWGSKTEAELYLSTFQAAWTHSPKLLAGFLEAHADAMERTSAPSKPRPSKTIPKDKTS
ncbi:hypothetical protein [Rhizobium sp. 9140]|uniref:hypothetical protein n=1 Tax=Rhizobium sp. 9140 TaxID=1761900 RepID=UPI00079BA445|nr:hypothetical protein [Rhizobium sp. 9140]CZT36068.1 hypothetical protein GA0004734_00030730 [Rhizobium sp. 9140]